MFVFHSIWNLPEVRKLVPRGKVVSILRNPVEAFESGYKYLGWQKFFQMDINQFAKSKAFGSHKVRKGG